MTARTFAVSEVDIKEVQKADRSYEEFLTKNIPALHQEHSRASILKATEAPNGFVQTRFSNGFVGAAFAAYSFHHHLIISPDDIWIAITTALSRYINSHSEEMRSLFVDHEGSKNLVVVGVGTIQSVNWDALISQMSEKIATNTKSEIQQWIEPEFSTTTPEIKTVGSVVLMGAMQKYFSYKFELRCGLPGVTMLGTLTDWQNIRQRIDKLLEFNQAQLIKWHQVLVPILDEFIRSYSGEVDKDFWNRIANQTGSGSGPRYLSGWILAFIPWNDSNTYVLRDWQDIQKDNLYGRVNMNDVPTSAVSVPVIIDDNGVEYNTTFYAGHLYATPGSIPNSIQPYLGWLMIHNK